MSRYFFNFSIDKFTFYVIILLKSKGKKAIVISIDNKSRIPQEWQNVIDESFRYGMVELLILAMLVKEDMYVYDIKQEIAKRSNGEFILRDGSMYGPMYRMAEKGLISSYQEIVGEKRFRKYYHLEELGKEYLSCCIERFYTLFGVTDRIISEYLSETEFAKTDKEEYDD